MYHVFNKCFHQSPCFLNLPLYALFCEKHEKIDTSRCNKYWMNIVDCFSSVFNVRNFMHTSILFHWNQLSNTDFCKCHMRSSKYCQWLWWMKHKLRKIRLFSTATYFVYHIAIRSRSLDLLNCHWLSNLLFQYLLVHNKCIYGGESYII